LEQQYYHGIMKLFDKIYSIYWNHKYVAKLKGHKYTKEFAHQLLWALKNDLKNYAKERNIELDFEVLPACIIYVKASLPEEINQNIEKYGITPFDIDIIWTEYRDILWTILNYKEELDEAYKRIDKIYNQIKN